MVRKAYDSDPVPFSLPRDLYRNGSHDVTYLVEQENITEFVEVKELFDIIKRDDKKLQINTGRGIADYFPTKKFRITVDPATVVGNGTVPPGQAGLVTDLEWHFSGNAITKNYLMMLDLLAHNNWERPVYYVSTTGRDAYIGLDDYLQLEGFAYRLIPVKQVTDQNQTGGVNTDVMFDNLMNKFKFDISKPGFLISDDIYRMTITMRSTYSRLVEALVAEKKYDLAIQVCDRIQELVPDDKVPYNYFNLSIAEGYMRAGQAEKGVEILQRMTGIQDEQLGYFFRFPENKRAYISMDIQQAMAVLHAVGQIAKDNNQADIADKAEETLELYYNLYVGESYNP